MRRVLFAFVFILCWSPGGVSAGPIDLFPDRSKDVSDGKPDVSSPSKDSKAKSSINITSVGIEDKTAMSMPSLSGQIEIPFEGTRSRILVEVSINGRPAYMLFDTGATYTSVQAEFAKKAGVLPFDETPRVNLSTANGRKTTHFGLIENFAFAQRSHFGVTYTICSDCPFGPKADGLPIVGLLGRNILRRYQYTIDNAKGVIRLRPGQNYGNRWADISPWVEIEMKKERYTPRTSPYPHYRRIRLVLEVENRSDREIESLKVRFSCLTTDGLKAYRTVIESIAGDSRTEKKMGLRFRRCRHLNWRAESAEW